MVAHLKKLGYPKDGYQLLCHNCNCAKGWYGACPHTEERVPRTLTNGLSDHSLCEWYEKQSRPIKSKEQIDGKA